ncbi:hypothetical protein ANOBCDAF_00198 [Pleomorphomonas sp. T1.2MG-36]|nr:hypothetical protein ANOBCDAF_00198 [Pleomorphomonas sp. T1.2MG-36]
MNETDWRDRLAQVIKDKDRTKRDVSLKAGNGPGYVHSILSEGRDPTIDNLIGICQELGVSVSYILYGFDISAEQEEILKLLENASPEARAGMISLLRGLQRP